MCDNPLVRKHQDILKLISLVKENPVLWDTNLTWGNMHDRRMVFNEIGKEMGCSSEDIKNKLRNLRAQFRREVARQIRLDTNRPKWIYYNALSFLRPFVEANEKNESAKERYEPDPISIDVEQDWDSSQISTTDINTTWTNFNEDSQFENHADSPPQLQNESDSEPSAKAAAATVERKANEKRVFVISQQSSEERDEYTIFGEHVANELRLLEPHKHLQKSLKCSILQSILDVNRANADNSTEEVYTQEDYLEEYTS